MATSILTVNDRHARFNDLDLLLVVRMVVSSLSDSDREKLLAVKEDWKRALEVHAPGVVDLPVQECANNADTREHLLSVLTNLESSLSAWGDEVPLSHLKNHCRIRGVVFERPYPTHHLLTATRQLRELISHGRSQ